MEVQVKVEKVLEPTTFSKRDGTQVERNAFVGVTGGQYPKHIKFDVLRKETWDKMGIKVGGTYNISFEIESHEWQNKYFTSVNAYFASGVNMSNGATSNNNNGNNNNANNNNNGGGYENLPY